VSKSEPSVVIVADPVDGAVQLYQTEAPPTLPPWFGSPVSFVAPTLEPAEPGED
jgi:hypothetical protein